MLSRTRSRRHFLQHSAALAGVGLLTGCGVLPAPTPQPARVRRIGYLSPGGLPLQEWEAESHDAFLQGIRDLGWVEGQNLTIEYRYAERRYDRFPVLADELVRAGVELIYAAVGSMARIARQVTSTIPIVSPLFDDPVQQGVAASLAHPGGNVTGLALANAQLMAKRVELLMEVAPGIKRLAVFWNAQPASQGEYQGMLRAVEEAARGYDVQIRYLDLLGPEPAQFEQAIAPVLTERPDALLVVPSPPVSAFVPRIAELAIANRWPSIGDDLFFPRNGLLLSYGASWSDLSRRAATYVDKILKGANPGDLPVEKPIKFDFGINLKTAQALSLTIPPSVLARATELIQ